MTERNIETTYFCRAKKVAWLLNLVPFVRMISVSGSLARGEATQKSDIDFFVVVKSGRLYSGRAMVTLMVQMMGLRRYGDNIAGRICLNRYHTDDNLEIHPKNLKHARDYTRLKVLTEHCRLFERYKYINEWMVKTHRCGFGPDGRCYEVDAFYLWPFWFFQLILEIIFDIILGDWGERMLKKYQVSRIMNNERTKKAKNGQIFVSETELRFHPEKRGWHRISFW